MDLDEESEKHSFEKVGTHEMLENEIIASVSVGGK